ncbi:MAG: MerR family transcriptional regulator [Candidatus Palauibacterales bacterium]|nr:MerR family transcriptional regulator [Candidatus Palauibacterales bacterium]MDP2528474.1 MerR family transcriptional regulator [Candidatus Palauibacterales bacterium]MDP2582997.1 MerR family transcriptional regulator [Candidatus Palauibacterales bacterium]
MANKGRTTGGEARHPISVVAERTGLSRHAIRAWERRYGLIEPDRSQGGHRLYSDAEIERLALLARLTERGERIGELAGLSTDELRVQLARSATAGRGAPAGGSYPGPRPERRVAAAMRLVADYDAENLETLLRRAALDFPAPVLIEEVLAPLLTRVGEAWRAGEIGPGQEHMASAAVTRAVGWLMEALPPAAGAPVLVVATPTGHRHELGALLVAATAVSEGWRVSYMAPDLPAADIAAAAGRLGARAVAVSLVYPAADPATADEIRRLRETLPAATRLLAGGGASGSYADVLDEVGAGTPGDLAGLREILRTLAPAA